MPRTFRNHPRLTLGSVFVIAAAAAATTFLLSGEDASAQRPRLQGLLQRPLVQQILNPRLEVEAVAGEPFGVGRVTIPLDPNQQATDVQLVASVSDRRGRILYPVYEAAPVRQAIRDLTNLPQRSTQIYFLFRGPEPLELAMPVGAVVQPRVDAAAYDRLLRAWWREYSGQGTVLPKSESGPPDVRTYLVGMLARRLNLPTVDLQRLETQRNELMQTVGVLFGTDTVRTSLEQEMLAGSLQAEVANLPLPAKLQPPAGSVSPQQDDVAAKIEPIAGRVPEECFYIRFGNFPNYLWLNQRIESVGGDLSNFLIERGIDTGERARVENQLCAHQSALAPVLGPQVIADVALIGTDTFQHEGAALGILFQANNNLALGYDLKNQRAEALKREPTAKEEKIQLGKVTASFLHTPDNRIRSFYVQDGDYHLLTTCRYIAERFVETGEGRGSLGDSAEFRLARQQTPADRGYTAFIYFSEAFQRNLLSPQYQVEMVRRLRSSVEMQLLELARLAAAAEQVPGGTIEQLIAAQLLPASFGNRPDGSRLIETKDGLADSVRGHRGTFLPVPDMPVTQITATEAQTLDRFRQAYANQWQQMDPLIVAVTRRQGADKSLEHVTVDAQASPLAASHFETLSKWLGPPSDQRLAPLPGDLIAAQASVRSGTSGNTGDHILFGALRDADPAFNADGIGAFLFRNWNARGYIGAWPQPGLLNLLGASANVPADANGFSRLLLGQWRRVYGQFTLLSFHPEVLEEVAPQLRFEQAPRPAQFWFRCDDLAGSKLAGKVNSIGYGLCVRRSQGLARFINSFSEQLHAPQKQDLALAEQLLNAKLVDPLGGKFELLPTHNGRPMWMSTVTNDPRFQGSGSLPSGYQFPALKWLRGMNLEMLMQPTQLLVHADIDLPVLTHAAGVELPLPSLPSLPSLPFSIPGFGGGEKSPDKKAADGAEKPPSTPPPGNGPAAGNGVVPPPPAPAPPAPGPPIPGPPAPDSSTKPASSGKSVPGKPMPGPPAPGE